MRKTGIDPYLYVYGTDESADVRVAKTVAAGEGIALDHRNRAIRSKMEPDEYRGMLENQYFVCDGMTNVGIFDSGQTLATRLERVSKAKLQLNGGGGEIYRNF